MKLFIDFSMIVKNLTIPLFLYLLSLTTLKFHYEHNTKTPTERAFCSIFFFLVGLPNTSPYEMKYIFSRNNLIHLF